MATRARNTRQGGGQAAASTGGGFGPAGFSVDDFIRRAAMLRSMAEENQERAERAVQTGRHGYLASQSSSIAAANRKIIEKFDEQRFEDIPPLVLPYDREEFANTRKKRASEKRAASAQEKVAKNNSVGFYPSSSAFVHAAGPKKDPSGEEDDSSTSNSTTSEVEEDEEQQILEEVLLDDSRYDAMILNYFFETGDQEAYNAMKEELAAEAQLYSDCQTKPTTPETLSIGKRPRESAEEKEEDTSNEKCEQEEGRALGKELIMSPTSINLLSRVDVLKALEGGNIMKALQLSGIKVDSSDDEEVTDTEGANSLSDESRSLRQEILLHGLCEIVVNLSNSNTGEDELDGDNRGAGVVEQASGTPNRTSSVATDGSSSSSANKTNKRLSGGGGSGGGVKNVLDMSEVADEIEDRRLERVLRFVHRNLAPEVSFEDLLHQDDVSLKVSGGGNSSAAQQEVNSIESTMVDLLSILALPNVVGRRLTTQDQSSSTSRRRNRGKGMSGNGIPRRDEEDDDDDDDDDDDELMTPLPAAVTSPTITNSGVEEECFSSSAQLELEAEEQDFIGEFVSLEAAGISPGPIAQQEFCGDEDCSVLSRLLGLQEEAINCAGGRTTNTAGNNKNSSFAGGRSPALHSSSHAGSPGMGVLGRNDSFAGRHSATNASYPATPATGPQPNPVRSVTDTRQPLTGNDDDDDDDDDDGLAVQRQRRNREDHSDEEFRTALQGMLSEILDRGVPTDPEDDAQEQPVDDDEEQEESDYYHEEEEEEQEEDMGLVLPQAAVESALALVHGGDEEEQEEVEEGGEIEEEEALEENEVEEEEEEMSETTISHSQTPYSSISPVRRHDEAASPSERRGRATSVSAHVTDLSPIMVPSSSGPQGRSQRLVFAPDGTVHTEAPVAGTNGSFVFGGGVNTSRNELQQKLSQLQERCGGILKGKNYYLYLLLSDMGLDEELVEKELARERSRLAERLNRWMLIEFYQKQSQQEETTEGGFSAADPDRGGGPMSLGDIIAESLRYKHTPLDLLLTWATEMQPEACRKHYEIPKLFQTQ